MDMVADGTVAIAGYSITKPIYAGTRTLVYQANRNIDQMPVVIKLMRNEYPSFKEIVQFRNQYTITKNLDLPGIVKLYSLEAYRNGYALIMEDMGGISLKDWIIQKQGDIINDFLNFAIQIATHLEAIHRHRIIHKDIKPSNILINPQTHQIKLIDFTVASLLPKQIAQLQISNILEGTLAYISPEQTGRMNRGIDYRSDFYALGVTFYELLTGRLPFSSTETMELVHSHIAKIAPDVHTINPSIPLAIAEIVAKLMAKNAEDRYQSAAGIKYDLEICLFQYQATKNIVEFALGSRDISEHFLIPEKLYGRTSEVETLLKAFDRVSTGATEMLLVAGCSGIGKTAVINELQKPIVRQRGYFIKGKYDQFQQDIPFLAFVQAFQNLISQILSESDAQIKVWRSKILSAVGDNGQVIIDVIPELENIIGKQSSVTELSGNFAQNRFNLLFQKFTQVFTTQAHPLVIFLDDLQWADLASLKLLELLMNDVGSLLVIGSYRDHEVSPAHPLMLTVQEIKKIGSIVNIITLNNLSKNDINYLVADTLSCDEIVAQPLTELIYQKTQGNPFFTTQFLKYLYEENLITFDRDARYWQCDIAQVKAVAIIDDVVEFMSLQLQKLPAATQDLLKLAACIGAQFDLNTLAIASARSPAATAADLWKALQDGFLLPTSEIYKFFTDADDLPTSVAANPTYKFLHDRVHEAAYSLIPDERKQSTHLRIGQLLLQNIPTSEQEARIFDIVNHLNRGIEVISTTAQRQELILLNFLAGKKARTATAYGVAVNYFAIAKSLLPANHWQRQYHLSLDIYHAAAEVAYLSGDIPQMEILIDAIFQNAESLLDTITAYKIRLNSYTANHQPTKSVAMGLEALKHLGVKFPQKPTKLHIILALLPIKLALMRKSPQDLLALPPMQNPTALAKMSLLSSILTASYMCEPNLHPLIILQQLELSLRYGNSAFVAPAYAAYGFILCMMGDIETGYQFGELGLRLTETGLGKQFRTEVLFIFSNMIRIWKDPLAATLETSLQGYQTGLETGKLEYAAYNAAGYCAALLHSGEQLDVVLPEFAKYSQSLQQLHQDKALTYHLIAQQLVLNLMGKSADPCCLVGEVYDEIAMQQKYIAAQAANSLSRLYTLKTWLGVLFGQEQQAVENAREAEKWIAGSQGTLVTSLFCFYQSLAELSIYVTASKSTQSQILRKVAKNLKRLKKWADYAPITYLHKWCLVTAEKHRVLGKMSAAMEMYDRAIALAKENQFLHEEAIACELAAKFYLNWGKAKVAQVYMIDAYYAYSRWGAVAKVDDLEKRYPQLLQSIRQQLERSLQQLQQAQEELLHSSQALQSTQNRLQKLAENAPGMIYQFRLAVDGSASFSYVSSGCYELFGLHPEEITDTDVLFAMLYPAERQNIKQSIIDSAANLTPWQWEGRFLVAGKEKWTQGASRPELQADGAIIWDGVLIDISANKFAEAALRQSEIQLRQKAEDLEKALYELQQTQTQLMQSEKMSALGNLVAGVAHEINNPIGFLSGNIDYALDYIKDLFGLIDLYQQEYSNPSTAIERQIKAIDLNYIRKDLPKMLASMQEAVNRICDISNSLRTFSRADSDRPIAFNIHDGIDSTILILKHRLKASKSRPAIAVIKNYGEIPQIKCYPGQLNQVFMNLLANAIDALEETNIGRSFEDIQAHPNYITITTSLSENSQQVIISIQDNGQGMTAEIKQKIFTQLITTKPVGKGTGLGLAIAHQIIVEKHGGTININSAQGQGAEFIITLPISQDV
ncbi:multi-sensor signal transduction multi-kinase [Nostoc carneum NIES-2107]|nr:multi-sensor signal transduction multi-kinase [Nostoc carneum NIES-2107]